MRQTTKEENKLNVFEMRCLRSIIGVSRRDRIRNVDIKRMTQSEKTIVEVIKIKRLKWFGHVCRKPNTSLVYQSFKQDFPNKRPKGRPQKRWSDHIRDDTGERLGGRSPKSFVSQYSQIASPRNYSTD